MSKVLRVLVAMLIVILSVFASLWGITVMSDCLGDTIQQYPTSSQLFCLHNVTEDKADKIYEAMKRIVASRHAIVVRTDLRLVDHDGGASGYNLGVFGDVRANGQRLTLAYLSTPILTARSLSSLLKASATKTLGLDVSRADMLEDLPNIHVDGAKLVVRQLDELSRVSKTKLGNYHIVGLTPSDYQQLLAISASIANVSAQTFQQNNTCTAITDSLDRLVFIVGCMVTGLLIAVIMIIAGYGTYKQLGSYLLLGWSRFDFAIRHLTAVVVSSLLSIPVVCMIFALMTNGFLWNSSFVLNMIMLALPVIAFVVLVSMIVLCMIVAVKPVNAIRNRISHHAILVVLAIVYAIMCTGILESVHSLDGPMNQLQHNAEIARAWKPVINQRIFYTNSVGNDATSIAGQSSKYAKDIYHWYRSIEDKPGVRLVHTSFYGRAILEDWRNGGVYQHVPRKPFWYFTVSKAYLNDHDFMVQAQDVRLAKQGTRVYFIPDTYSTLERNAIQSWIRESDNVCSTDVTTAFTKHPSFAFRTYHAAHKWFNWTTSIQHNVYVNDPIIFYAHSNNLNALESESLLAGGLDNSYIKLNLSAEHQYLNDAYASQYHLDDNHIRFLPVGEFIAGIQKNILQTLQFFGGAIGCVSVVVIVLLLAMMTMYASNYEERIAVERLLGFSLIRIFSIPFMLVFIVHCALLILAFVERTRFGALYIATCGVVELLLLLAQTYYLSRQRIVALIKQ